MTTPVNVEDDNLAHQIMDAMDSIRAVVWPGDDEQPPWRDRLVDANGLEAQQAHLEEMKLEFRRAVKFAHRFCPDGGIRCNEVDCDDGTPERVEFWQLQDSQSKTDLVSIFEEAIQDIDFWKQELEFQRLWMDAAFWASRNGHALFAKRLGDAYRMFYGARPILNQIESSFVPSGRTVRAVANEIRAKAFGRPITEPEQLDWSSAQGAEILLQENTARQNEIYHTMEARGLLDDPVASEVGGLLHFAYYAVLFQRRFDAVDHVWCTCIFDALDDGKVSLAAALMRYYGHFFGTVYLFQGLRIDRPSNGCGHVQDNPTAEEAKRCLLECNRLRTAWIEQQEEQEKARAAAERSQALLDAQVPDQRRGQPDADV